MSARRLSGDPCGPGDISVPSASSPDHEWVVTWINSATRYCPCQRFASKNRCRHTTAALELVDAEWRERQRLAQSTPESRAAAAKTIADLQREFSR